MKKKDNTMTWILVVLGLIAAWFFLQTPKLNSLSNAANKVNSPVGSILAGLAGLFSGNSTNLADVFGSNSQGNWVQPLTNAQVLAGVSKPADITYNILD
jgi:hypothetical protein